MWYTSQMSESEKKRADAPISIQGIVPPVRTQKEQDAELRERREAGNLSPHRMDLNLIAELAQRGEPLRFSHLLHSSGPQAVFLTYQDLVDLRAPLIFISRTGARITMSHEDPEVEDDSQIVLFPEMLGEIEGQFRKEISQTLQDAQNAVRTDVDNLKSKSA